MSHWSTKPVRVGIDLVAGLIRSSTAALRHLLSSSLRDEVRDFARTRLFQEYWHIEAVCAAVRNRGIHGGLVLDVGAADGTTAAIFLKEDPAFRVYLFEPLPENIAILRTRFGGDTRVSIRAYALGERPGSGTMHRAKRNTSSSLRQLNPAPRKDSILRDSLTEIGTESVELSTVDAEVAPEEAVAILKLDVQGFEREVLAGAASTLTRTSAVVLEVNNHTGYDGAPTYHELDAILRGRGFVLFDLFPSTHDTDGQLKEWDAIYMRADLL